jgi:hypothetical protein
VIWEGNYRSDIYNIGASLPDFNFFSRFRRWTRPPPAPPGRFSRGTRSGA